MKPYLIINCANLPEQKGRNAVIIPERALADPSFIRTLSINQSATSKHEFHAMSQIALSQFQDGELAIETVSGPLTISSQEKSETVSSGIIIFIDQQEKLHLIGNTDQSIKQLLKIAHRFCTRWIRLDI